jgi:nucleotide-binding universal stress UspA family protein
MGRSRTLNQKDITMATFRSVVCAVDFSDTSQDALAVARDIAQQSGGRLFLVNVVLDPLQLPWSVETAGIDFAEMLRTWIQQAEQDLSKLVASQPAGSPPVTSAVIVGRPAAEIVRYAEEHAADVLVMGTHGYGLVKRFLLGSVADQVLRQATCPVLVVPHQTLRRSVPSTQPHTTTSAGQR